MPEKERAIDDRLDRAADLLYDAQVLIMRALVEIGSSRTHRRRGTRPLDGKSTENRRSQMRDADEDDPDPDITVAPRAPGRPSGKAKVRVLPRGVSGRDISS